MKVMVVQGDNVVCQSGASNFVIDPKQAKDQKRSDIVASAGPVRVGIMQGSTLISGETPPVNKVTEEKHELRPEDIVPPEPGVSDQPPETEIPEEEVNQDEGSTLVPDDQDLERQDMHGQEDQTPPVGEEDVSQERIPAPTSSTTQQMKQRADNRRHVIGNPYGSNFIPDPAESERMRDY